MSQQCYRCHAQRWEVGVHDLVRRGAHCLNIMEIEGKELHHSITFDYCASKEYGGCCWTLGCPDSESCVPIVKSLSSQGLCSGGLGCCTGLPRSMLGGVVCTELCSCLSLDCSVKTVYHDVHRTNRETESSVVSSVSLAIQHLMCLHLRLSPLLKRFMYLSSLLLTRESSQFAAS